MIAILLILILLALCCSGGPSTANDYWNCAVFRMILGGAAVILGFGLWPLWLAAPICFISAQYCFEKSAALK